MSANRSTAVMQSRHEPHDSLDYFPTPPWATRALCERLMALSPIHRQHVWEPACGEGHMARPLGEYFDRVYASDVHDYADTFLAQDDVCDFLCSWDHPIGFVPGPPGRLEEYDGADWIITNPPFRLAEEFIRTALMHAHVGVAVFVRSAFLEGNGRYRSLFNPMPPALILQFVERVSLVKGRLDKDASNATSYCWVVWLKDRPQGTSFDWIAPCRARLERAHDYPMVESELAPAPLFDQAPRERALSPKGAMQGDAADKRGMQ